MTFEELFELCHGQAHNAEHNPENTVLMALTRRDCWMFTLAILLLEFSAPCLVDQCADFAERLAELLDTQRPDWRDGPQET